MLRRPNLLCGKTKICVHNFFCGICQLRRRKTLLILIPKLPTAERLDLGSGVEDWIAAFFLRLPHTQSRATPVVFALDRDSNTPATQLCTKKCFFRVYGPLRSAIATSADCQRFSPSCGVHAGSCQVPSANSLPMSRTTRSRVRHPSYTKPSQ